MNSTLDKIQANRFLRLVVSLIVVFALAFPTTALALLTPQEASATESEQAQGEVYLGTWVNPLFADAVDAAGIPTDEYSVALTSADEDPVFLEHDEAVAYAKEQMMYDSRSSEFYLYFIYHGDSMNSTIAGNVCRDLIDEVYDHTGAGSEGDYILQHLFSCQRYLVGFEEAEAGVWHLTYRIVPSSLSDGDKEREVDAKVDEVLGEILTPCMSDYEKVEAIYFWLVNNCSYASGRDWYVYSAWGAIVAGDAVCHGYSLALYKMLNDAGIDCRYEANDYHAWNIVRLGDKYYYCDSTWENGNGSQFLKCWNDFEDYYHTGYAKYFTEEWTSRYPMSETTYDVNTATDGSNEQHHTYETSISDGVTTHACIYCDEAYTGDHAEDHTISHFAAVEPTCEGTGSVEYWHCTECGLNYTDSSLSDASIVEDVSVAALGHDAEHVEAVANTAFDDGNVEYWHCSVCDKYFLDETLSEETTARGVVVPATGNIVEVTVNLAWTDAEGNAIPNSWIPDTAEVALMGIETDGTSSIVATADMSKADGWAYTFDNMSGDISYTLGEMIDGNMVSATYDADTHSISAAVVVHVDVQFDWAADYSTCTAEFFDKNQEKFCDDVACTITTDTLAEASCTDEGLMSYTAEAVVDDISYIDTETAVVEALGHDYVASVVDPTCTDKGYTSYTCSRCDDTYTDNYTDALGHAWDEGVVTTEATPTTPGVMTYTCTVCGDIYTEEIPATGSTDLHFADLPDTEADEWYFEAVYTLAQMGIINGYTDETGELTGVYGIGDAMTRAQFITVLWRYVEPEAYAAYDEAAAFNTTQMTDIADGTYYTAAVDWALDAGIITGYASSNYTLFGPDDEMSFEDAVNVLARYVLHGVDAADEYDTSLLDTYSDGGDVDTWARGGFAWAIEEGIVHGYAQDDDTPLLKPKETLTRERGAAILNRAINENHLL